MTARRRNDSVARPRGLLARSKGVGNGVAGLAPLPPFAAALDRLRAGASVCQVKIAERFAGAVVILVLLPIVLAVAQKRTFGLGELALRFWFGAQVAVRLRRGFLGPPVVMSADPLCNLVPKWSLSTISEGMGNFIAIQVPCLISLTAWPERVLWLPRLLR